MTTDNQELDKILIKFGADCMEPAGQTMRVFNEAEAALLKWSDKRLLDLIGTMETAQLVQPIMPFQTDEQQLEQWKRAQIRDGLRAELRNKLEANHEG